MTLTQQLAAWANNHRVKGTVVEERPEPLPQNFKDMFTVAMDRASVYAAADLAFIEGCDRRSIEAAVEKARKRNHELWNRRQENLWKNGEAQSTAELKELLAQAAAEAKAWQRLKWFPRNDRR